MIDQEFHGGRDNEFTAPLAETAREERFAFMHQGEKPRTEESAASAQTLRETEEDARREQRRRRAMKSRPLVQVTAVAMAVVVTGGVAMNVPEPVAEIVEVIETAAPGVVPPDDVRAWLDRMMELCELGADDETYFAEMQSEGAEAACAWWSTLGPAYETFASDRTDLFYYDGAVYDTPGDAPAVSLNYTHMEEDRRDVYDLAGNVIAEDLNPKWSEFCLRYLRTGSAYESEADGVLLSHHSEEFFENGTKANYNYFGRASGTLRDWAPVRGAVFCRLSNCQTDADVVTGRWEGTISLQGSYQLGTSGMFAQPDSECVFLEDGFFEYQEENSSIDVRRYTARCTGTVSGGYMTPDTGCTVERIDIGDEIWYGLRDTEAGIDVGGIAKSIDELLYHNLMTMTYFFAQIGSEASETTAQANVPKQP